MLAKLMKYEFKATGRFMLLMFGLLLVLSVLLGIQVRFNFDLKLIGNILLTLLTLAFVLMNGIVLSAMFFFAITRFRNNLLGSEGYLMHTLPVNTGQHILAKTFVSAMWTILSCVAVGISYILLFLIGAADTSFFSDLIQALRSSNLMELLAESQFWLILAEVFLCAVIMLLSIYLQIYACMAVGYSFNRHRAAIAIGVFIAIEFADSILQTVGANYLLTLLDSILNFNGIHIILWAVILYSAVCGLIFYLITRFFLSRRLNLL